MADMIALPLLIACSTGPSVSTETRFVGRLVDEAGEPIPDVEVRSVEGQHRTDAQGRFAVPLQPPTKLVHFVMSDVFYQRVQFQQEIGTEAVVMLPKRVPRNLVCPPMPCSAVSLTWRLDPKLSAKATPACTPGAALVLDAVPMQEPAAICRTGSGSTSTVVPLTIDRVGATWKLREAGGDVTVEVRDLEGAPVPDCLVRVGEAVAAPQEDGTYHVRAHEPGVASAVCDGRPAPPVNVLPLPEGIRVPLTWTPDGPNAYVGTQAPWARYAHVRYRNAGWDLPLELDQGLLRLPPLLAGQYVVFLRADDDFPLTKSPEPINAADVLSFTQTTDDAWVGRLNLPHDKATGPVKTHVAPKR